MTMVSVLFPLAVPLTPSPPPREFSYPRRSCASSVHDTWGGSLLTSPTPSPAGPEIPCSGAAVLLAPSASGLGSGNSAPLLASERDLVESQSALTMLREMYQTSWRAPEAFRWEYVGSTVRAVALVEASMHAALDAAEDDGRGDAPGANALHYAAGCGCVEACAALLRRRAGLNFHQDGHGATPLIWAARRGLARTAELLLNHGADAGKADARGLTALHCAAAGGCARVCQLLLETASGAHHDIDRLCHAGLTSLHFAAQQGSVSACQVLVEAGADPGTATAGEGRVPLHLAAARGHTDALEYLAPLCGGDLTMAEDDFGHLPAEVAAAAGFRSVAAMPVLRDPEEEHRERVSKWSRRILPPCRSLAGMQDVDAMVAPDTPSLDLGPLQVLHVSGSWVELVALVTDLEYRLLEYVLEVRHFSGGREGAAPVRVYYARVGKQRKVDQVKFKVPRLRPNGHTVWERGEEYQFRLIGRAQRSVQDPCAARRALSSWSEPALMVTRGRPSRKSGTSSGARRLEAP